MIIAAANTPAGKNKAGHSQLYEWYWAHYDTLSPHLLPPRTPNWPEIARKFAVLVQRGEPVNDGLGRPPNATICRHTWWKVVRDKQRVASGSATIRRRQKPAQAPSINPVKLATETDIFDEIVLRAADGSIYDPRKPNTRK
jgi:hypothetical protein